MKGLEAAAAQDLPDIVAIAGPNGSGKTALLEQLWRSRHNFMEPQTSGTWVKITFEVESGCVDLVGGGAAVAGA